MPELQHPDIVGNYLGSMYQAQDRGNAQKTQQFNQQRLQRQDERAETTFADQQDVGKLERASKVAELQAQLLGGVADGDVQGFEMAKQQFSQATGVPMEQLAGVTIDRLPALRLQSGQTLKELQAKLVEAQIGAQRANTAQSYAAAEASRAAASRGPGNIDPNTGVRIAPSNIQGKDASQLQKYEQTAEASNTIAAILAGAKPALDKGMTGPGFEAKRNVAGLVSLLPDFGIEKAITGRNVTQDYIETYDTIDATAMSAGIKKLEEIGGSDTNRELLTAIKTTVNNSTLPGVNAQRYRDALKAAEIISTKSRLASEWVNKFGSLNYAAPDGTTWQGFWPAYQRDAWAQHRKPSPNGSSREGAPAPSGITIKRIK